MLRRDVLTSVCAILMILSSFNFVTLNSFGDIAATISTVSGTNVDDKFGWNVSDCGDVNGDEVDDIIVGAPGYNGDQGRAYIFFGGSGFIGDLISDSADVILEGSGAGALFGWDVSGAGDFNGDGFNDTIVGAPGNNTNTGAAYIFYGSSSLGGTISSNNANITIDGENSGDFFGSSVSDLGDVSKETPIDHVVISEVYANAVDETSPDIGEFMELYNPTSSPVLLNNWVIEDFDSHSFTLMGTIPAYGFFLIAINNYLGSTDPLEASWPTPDFDCGYTGGSVFANSGDEIRLKDDMGFIIDTFGYGAAAEWYEGIYYPTLPSQGVSYERKLGETQSNGGNAIDTDHNGNDFAIRSQAEPQPSLSPIEVPPSQSMYSDVIVGAYGWGNDKGRAYIFFGSSGDPINASSADVILTGEADNHLFGFSVSGAGDVNSDGFDDILVGAPGYDNYRGRGYIYHGSQNMRGWTQEIVFAHWDESTGAVYDIANVYAIYEKRWLAQSFTPDKDYLLTKLWLYLDNTGTTTIAISLEGHNNGPDGNILATADPKPNNPSSPMPLTWVEFEFTTPFQATAGTMYWITARATGKNTNNCWGWLQDLDPSLNYTGGYSAFAINPPAAWTEEPDYDYWFKALGRLPSEIPPDITLTGGAQGDLFGWSVSDAGDIGGDGFDDVIIGALGTANGNAYLINGSNAMKDVTVAGIVWGKEKQFTNWETGGDMEPAVYTGQFIAQSFFPQGTYLQTNVSLLLKTFGTQGTLTIKLMGSTGSSPDTVPDGVVLAQAPSISTGNVSYEWTNFEWLIPYTCIAGTEYFIVAEGTGSDTSNCWGWYGQRVGNYPEGDSAFDQGGGWTAYDADFYFRAFGSSQTALPNITLQGESPGDLFGYSVSSAGNFNGDAYDDIVVAAPGNGNGKVYIFNSSSIMPPIIQAVNANYTALGEGPMDWFGWSVSLAGNVNTTVGNFEVIVGAPFQDPGGNSDAGKAYIYSYSSPTPIPPNALPEILDVITTPNPQVTGEYVNISCNVTDDVGVSSVWLNITLPGGGYNNVSLTKGTGDQWYRNDTYIPLGGYNYVIWANDTSNAWNSSSGHSFTIFDPNFPVISNVMETPDPQETGGYVNITCNVTDVGGVFNVWMNMTLPSGGNINISLTKGAGNEWFNNSIYSTLGTYDYVIWANDTSDNWNTSSGHSFTIQDTTLPVISNILDVPDPQEVGGPVNITCDVTDNIGISNVWMNITLPGGGYTNLSMTKGLGDEWYNNTVYGILGVYDYVIWVNDTSNNWNSSSGHSFTIQDTTLPVISNVLDNPDPQVAGGSVNITVDVTDNAGVYDVWVNITLPSGGSQNVSMSKGTGDSWFNNTIYTILGIYDYVIWTNDTSNNWNSSSGHSFTIQDTTLPVISNVLDVPDPQEVGGSVNISCDVMDIMGIFNVWVNITLPSGSSLNVSMNKGTGDCWFNDTVYTILGIYDYVIWTNDTSGNWNSSSGHSFAIQDTTLPVISNVLDIPDPQETGSFVNITCEITDTVGIFNVWVNITLPGGGYLNVSMTKGPGNIWYNEELYWLLGTYDYVIWANDTSGNWNGSFGHSFSILPGAPFDIIIISGDGQISSVATKLTAPLVVEVRDQFGNPVPNANVWFNVTLGGGTVDIVNPVVTGGNGRAQANITLGTVMGLNTVTAEIAGGGVTQVIFTATGIPGAIYDIVIISGNSQSGIVGMQLPEPMVVEVHDQFGNTISNAEVWFNVTLGSGTVDVTNPVLTGNNGRAQTNLTLGTTSGSNTVIAEIGEGGITQVIFTATGGPDEPYYIMILSGNGQSGKVGTLLADPFVVEVTDQYGNPVPNTMVWFNTTSGDGSLDTTSPLFTDNLGRAQVNLTLGPNAGMNSLTAEMSSGSTTQVTFVTTGISNKPEIITSIADIEMLEDDPPYSLFLFASAIDDEDLPKDLKWFITDIDNSLYSVSGQGTNVLIITPKPDMYGNDQVTLLVEDSDGLQDSQPLWINITPINDKPFFFPEPPDLTVTKDISYTFNYAPYLFDIDNNIGELTLTSDDPDYTSINGHLVTYLYPSSMLNNKVFVTLTVSDGIDSSVAVIQINISEDNVPVLKEKLPNVIIYEGEIKYNVFNLDDYFYDPDGDAVYFSYGYSHIIIMINENHSVDFYAHSDWFGEETVTFRARDPSSAIVEDTISVTVFPVNDPPVISDLPDLVVHYDASYYFNLTPYISDADNSDAELSLTFMEFINGTWLISENINISNDNNLKMEINYSKMYLDMKIQVRIEVSDGIDSAWDIINITVSEDWPPQLIMNIPDVVFYEDEYISNHLNVHDYFTDRDDDTLFFTYGQEHIQVAIHENGSVDFYADENWYGIENITVRATDPSGALVEDIITVTVLPVNDAPVISRIPDQEGVLGITWILDISPYIQDIDNNITEMLIICESPYISAVGAVLIFQYPSDVEEDTVQVTVYDPSNADATTAFNVTLTKAGIGGRNELDVLQLIWIIILIIAILTTILLLYAYQRGKYEVEEVLLVYRKKGLLVSYKHKSEKVKMDRDLMTGMFTAIQDFVNDVFESEDMSGTPLKVMELGDKKVMIEHGKYTYLAAVFKGGTWRLITKLKTTLADLEVKYKDVLEDWDGNMEALEGIDTFLDDIVTLE